jgi:PAS domain S-box-containing protein
MTPATKGKPRRTRPSQIEQLRRRLEEAEETLRAIRSGEVDALVVSGDQGDQVYTLKDADRPYRALVEQMSEGALTLNPRGEILYCNVRMAQMLGAPHEHLAGTSFSHWIVQEDRTAFELLLEKGREGEAGGEVRLGCTSGEALPVQLSLSPLVIDGIRNVIAIAMDLRERKQAEQSAREMLAKLNSRANELGIANEELRVANEELDSARTALEKERQRYRDLFDFAPDGYLVTDLKGEIREANRAAALQLGVPVDGLVGTCLASFVHWDDIPRFQRQLAQLDDGEEDSPAAADITVTLQPRRGVPFVGSIKIGVIRDPNGNLPGLRWLIRDISNLVQAEREVRQLNAELERRVAERTDELQTANALLKRHLAEREQIESEIKALNRDLERRAVELEIANRELDSFSYSVSHDLRTPLSLIQGLLESVLEDQAGRLAPETERFLHLAQENAAAMQQLIEGLLTFSRSTRQTVNTRTVDPGEIAAQALEELRGTWAGRQVETRVAPMPACQADPVLLKQVYMNLLSNAIKFTRTREVARIEIGCGPCEGEEGPAYFVRDNGVGFDMEQAERLFGVFQRFHSAEQYEGTGVGLAIVERIIRRHGGRIWADAAVNRGATFYFTLP